MFGIISTLSSAFLLARVNEHEGLATLFVLAVLTMFAYSRLHIAYLEEEIQDTPVPQKHQTTMRILVTNLALVLVYSVYLNLK